VTGEAETVGALRGHGEPQADGGADARPE